MNSIARIVAWTLLLGTATPGAASAQAGSFPIVGGGPPEISIGIAWDGARFLAGMQANSASQSAVLARFVETSGQPGPLVTVAANGGSPRIAFGGGQYLLAWSDFGGWPNYDIHGMFVQPDGSHAAAFPISSDALPEDVTGIAYAGGKFIVAYTRGNSLLARRVTLAGVVGPELTLTNSYYAGLSANNVGTDGSSYLVAWVDDGNRSEVRARVVFTAGLPGTEFSVNASPESSADILTVAGTPSGYLVVYADEIGAAGSGEWDTFAQAVSATGAPVGSPHRVSSAPGKQWLPFLASDGADYLITWTDTRWDANHDDQCDPGEGTCWDIYARYLSSDGTPLGCEWPIIALTGDQYVSPMAFGAGRFLTAWTDGSLQQHGGNVHGLFLPPIGGSLSYCTAGTTTNGCTPSIAGTGLASASAGSGFTIAIGNVEGGQSGLIFYGLSGAVAFPWGTGTSYMCVKSPLERAPVQGSGGTPGACNGVFSLDWNLYVASNPSALGNPLVGGELVRAQAWFRDPPSPKTTALSNGLLFVVSP